MGGLAVLAALLPVSQAWIGKLIVDRLVLALQRGDDPAVGLASLLPLLLLGFALVTVGTLVGQGYTLLEHMLNARVSYAIHEQIMRTAVALDLAHFEQAEFYNRLQNARREADYRAITLVNALFAIVQGAVTLLSFAALLLALSPLVALILFGATLPAFLVQAKYGGLYFRLLSARAPEFRRMHYLQYLLTIDSSAKEIKLFELGNPLLQRYHRLFWRFYHEDARLARQRSAVSVLWGMLSTASFYAAYAWVAWQALLGRLTLGDLTLYLALFQTSQSTFRSTLAAIGQVYESGLFLENLFSYLHLHPTPESDTGVPCPRPLRHGIELRDVSFTYPGSQHAALHHLSLHIRAGETLALVGSNGAGKTTLIKLLTRLYDPDAGAILLDGVDLRQIDRHDLHRQISVIFQDYVQYQTTLRENIGFGDIEHLHDDARLHAAATRSGANSLAERLPSGYDTMLGRWFAEGYELSGGEWQKVALARALLRDAELLVFDEPTAALDAEREAAMFAQLHDLTRDKTTLLISHRFSTVRMADRIAVLHNGQIVELGTHAELLAQNGRYAHMYRLQAASYQD